MGNICNRLSHAYLIIRNNTIWRALHRYNVIHVTFLTHSLLCFIQYNTRTSIVRNYNVAYLSYCYFLSQWKDGNVTPIYKKDEKSLPSNYRPITLLSLVGKLMERCVRKRLYNYTRTYRLITPLQSGFIQGNSTTYQYNTFCEAVDSGKEIRVVFCDVSKAFDRVWHRSLLHKLRAIGCSEKVTQ